MLRFERVGDGVVLRDWRDIHNLIIPTAPLSEAEVAERAGRNRLEVAYLGDVAVGNSTVRAPADGSCVVIARVLPEHRRRGFGELIYRQARESAREWGATTVETIVLESNQDGLRFALRHGFAEVDRYVLPGDTVPFIELRLAPAPG